MSGTADARGLREKAEAQLALAAQGEMIHTHMWLAVAFLSKSVQALIEESES